MQPLPQFMQPLPQFMQTPLPQVEFHIGVHDTDMPGCA